MTQIYQLRMATLADGRNKRVDIVRAHDQLAVHGRWGLGGWWKPNNIAAAKRHIREEGFVVRRTKV